MLEDVLFHLFPALERIGGVPFYGWQIRLPPALSLPQAVHQVVVDVYNLPTPHVSGSSPTRYGPTNNL